jgi:hypothetical protein
VNFVALTVNTAECRNVFRYQAALGDDTAHEGGSLRGMASGDDKFPDTNCGALYMKGAGNIPTLMIDQLELQTVDLIMLDIEGGELAALRGARHTIFTSQPVVVFEDKGLGQKFYGEDRHGADEYMCRFHRYKVAARGKIDTVMVPE